MTDIELSQAHREAVIRRRRVILQEDANMPFEALGMDIHRWLEHRFCLIDKGAPVDAIFWDIGLAEDTFAVHNGSALLPPDPYPGYTRWREAGVDWGSELINASHERGIEAFWSHRICPVESGARGTPLPDNPLKKAHPDWVVPCWWAEGNWNLASSGLQEHKLKFFRELFELYDWDGLLIDFARHTPCLPPGREWEHRGHVTEFLRRTRRLLLETEQRKGKPLLLAVRVGETILGNHCDGFEVESWAAENLVDIFVLGGRTTSVDLAAFRHITAGTPIRLYPCFDGHHTDDGYYYPPVEHFRGVFSNWLLQGADGIDLFNWTCASEELYDRLGLPGDMKCTSQRQVLLELNDPTVMQKHFRSYAVERRGGYPWAQNYLYRNDDKPLPLEVLPGERLEVPIFVLTGYGSAITEVNLILIFWKCNPEDIAITTLNGHPVKPTAVCVDWRDGQVYCDRPQPTAGGWTCYPITDNDLLRVEFRCELSWLRCGKNQIAVTFSPQTVPGATWEKAELTLTSS